jgi:hypothetical protein
MSGDDDLDDILGPEPSSPDDAPEEILVDAPQSSPMGKAARGLLERSRTYPVGGLSAKRTLKNTPDRLRRLLSYVAEMPVATDAARRAGISFTTLKYWLQKSKEGNVGDGFDVPIGENDETDDTGSTTVRFHLAWDDCMEEGIGLIERTTHQRATGYSEPLTYQGRVKYRIDPKKYDEYMLMDGVVDENNPDLWLRDTYGAPVPETVMKQDPDLAMFLLKTRKPQVYGNKAQVDVNFKGGVLVVGMQMQKPEDLNVLENQYRTQGLPDVIFEEDETSLIEAEA